MVAKGEDRFRNIFEEKGDRAAFVAKKILLEGVESEMLKKPLQYLVTHRKDLLRPTLMNLACEAVGGNPENVLYAAVAMILECYNIGLIDDIIDKTKTKRFSFTLPGQFDPDVSLITSIIINARAYLALSRLSEKLQKERYEEVNRVFCNFLVRMVEGEVLNIKVKSDPVVEPLRLLKVFEMESADIEACTKIGAIIGNGTREEVEAFGKYGRILGKLFLIREDLKEAMNFSVELGTKLMRGSYPFPIIWALNQSNEAKDYFLDFKHKKTINPSEIKRCVQLLFELGAINHTTQLMEDLVKDAIEALSVIKDNEAKKKMGLIAEAQPQLAFKVFFLNES